MNAILDNISPPTDDPAAIAVIRAQMSGAIMAAVRFYDIQRADYSERGARAMAELYLRRKVDGLESIDAAEVLAEALAVRAAARIKAAEAAIVYTCTNCGAEFYGENCCAAPDPQPTAPNPYPVPT